MKIAFVTSQAKEAKALHRKLEARYGRSSIDEADVIVALGGDGLMLQTARRLINTGKPLYGMHCGSVGFLMNDPNGADLPRRLSSAEKSEIHPLIMRARPFQGKEQIALAINEVSMLRQTQKAGKLRISINNHIRMEELICDGALISTPAGSTAYNLSAHGAILPIDSPLLALTPLNPFRPRRWRGALLSNRAHIRIDVLDPENRPVAATADCTEVRDIEWVEVEEDASSSVLMLFDPGHNLDERILREQFVY